MSPKLSHGDTDGLIIQDHTTRLSRVEDSFQELLPIVSQTQTVIMGINEALQEIKSDVKALKEGHDDVSKNLIKFGQRIDVLDEWKAKKERHKDLVRKTIYGAIGTIVAALVIYFFGLK